MHFPFQLDGETTELLRAKKVSKFANLTITILRFRATLVNEMQIILGYTRASEENDDVLLIDVRVMYIINDKRSSKF